MADIILTDEEIKRFWLKTRWNPWNGCLEWTACKTIHGYAGFAVRRRRQIGHRVAWAIANGAIPEGMCVLHRCDNPPCVNVDHLFLGTHQDNYTDMVEKGRGKGGVFAKCHKGHEFTAGNTRVEKNGARRCRKCMIATGKAYYSANRDKILREKLVYNGAHREAQRAYHKARRARLKGHPAIGG